jgi:hypothetical protein
MTSGFERRHAEIPPQAWNIGAGTKSKYNAPVRSLLEKIGWPSALWKGPTETPVLSISGASV